MSSDGLVVRELFRRPLVLAMLGISEGGGAGVPTSIGVGLRHEHPGLPTGHVASSFILGNFEHWRRLAMRYRWPNGAQ
jgi:hypothetical protein